MNPIFQTLASELMSSMAGKPAGGAQGGDLIQGVVAMFLKPAASTGGQGAGLEGLFAQFQNSGLDDLVASWIGTGPNKAISAEGILKALGQDNVAAFGAKNGLKPEDAASSLADILPNLINQLTPGGKIEPALVKGLIAAVT